MSVDKLTKEWRKENIEKKSKRIAKKKKEITYNIYDYE